MTRNLVAFWCIIIAVAASFDASLINRLTSALQHALTLAH